MGAQKSANGSSGGSGGGSYSGSDSSGTYKSTPKMTQSDIDEAIRIINNTSGNEYDSYIQSLIDKGYSAEDVSKIDEAAYNSLLNKNQINLLSLMNKSGLSSYHQLKNCYVDNEDEKLPIALKFVKELDPNCYSRVHGGGFAGTILMIIHRSKLKEILPLLKKKFGKENVMKIKLIDYGTTRLKEEEICKY
jgi:hypothetical protein